MTEVATQPISGKINLSTKQGYADIYLEDDITTELLLGGGAGGGKTFYGCAWQLRRRLMYPETRGLIGRRTVKDLKDTTLMTLFDVCRRMGLRANVHYVYQSQLGRITFYNGSIIFLRELEDRPSDPDFGDLGSLELTDAFIDQAEQISKKAFQIVKSRIRFNLINGLRKILLTANPAHVWLKEYFVIDKHGNPAKLKKNQKFVQALLADNPDSDFKDHYSANLDELDHYDMRRLKFGDWTIIENDKPFFDLYDSKRNTSKIPLKIDPYNSLWLSFDFNINPTTVIISQKLDNVGCRTYDVLQAIGTDSLCDVILDKYGRHPGGYQVTGDHSGHSGSSAAGVLSGGQYHTDFEIIKRKLSLTSHDLVGTQSANARHIYSRRLCRHFFSKVPYLIDETMEGCGDLKADLQKAKEINGKLYKNREDGNPMDVADAFRYQVSGWFQGDFSVIDDYVRQLG